MPRLIGAMLARNEAGEDRYLRRVLQSASAWCDKILVLDDRSTDDTVAVCREEGAIVATRSDLTPAWGNEYVARRELWDLAAEVANDYRAWLLIFDADMILSADPRPLLATEALNTWCWPLYDLWESEQLARTDGMWKAHVTPRPWLVCPHRVPVGWQAEWPKRGLHCGHLPYNWPMHAGYAPKQYWWNHLAYVRPEHRAAKHAQYLSQSHQLNEFERQHAESVIDPTH